MLVSTLLYVQNNYIYIFCRLSFHLYIFVPSMWQAFFNSVVTLCLFAFKNQIIKSLENFLSLDDEAHRLMTILSSYPAGEVTIPREP
jgi:hypothetical protein